MLLAVACPWLSGLPTWLAALASVGAMVQGMVTLWRERRRPPQVLDVDAHGGITLQGRPLRQAELHRRGPVWVLRGRCDARRIVLVWWPGMLGADGRRALRLALPQTGEAQHDGIDGTIGAHVQTHSGRHRPALSPRQAP